MITLPLASAFVLAGPTLLVFTRIVALFVAGPIIGGSYAPMQAKAMLAAAVTAVIAPQQLANAPHLEPNGLFALLVVKEAMVGFTLGFFVSLFFEGVRFGGDLANRNAGYSAAEYFDPENDDTISPIGDLFHIAAVVLFFSLDGYHLFFAALSRSFAIIPLGGFGMDGRLVEAMIGGVHELTSVAIAIGFPVISIVMAITVAEGVIVRAVPQINMLNFSFAVKTLVSLVVLYAGMPAAVAFLATVLAGVHEATFALIPLMR